MLIEGCYNLIEQCLYSTSKCEYILMEIANVRVHKIISDDFFNF
jgi:hypothetical protein